MRLGAASTLHKEEQMNYQGADTIRIAAEYERRAREIPRDFYSLGRPGNLLMHCQAVRSCIAALQDASLFPLSGRRIADIGCGEGNWLLEFAQWGADPADLAGIDLMEGRVESARRRIPQADLHVGCASELPWPDESFDVVSQFMAFMNMFDPALKRAVASEMLRVLKPGGAVLWFDVRIDNPNNSEVKGLRRKEIESLFPGCAVHLRPAILAPPLARSIANRLWALGEALHIIPVFRTHYAGCIRKLSP
jgi:ubiquinone/menaquinone biosynthesis C-methylase UbiE